MSQTAGSARRVVVVDGCRTPFCRSGTAFNDLTTYDLGRMAVSGLLRRTRIDPEVVDLLVMGTVIADPRTSNLGREVVLASQLPTSCPAYTVSVACVSSLQAFLDCARAIADRRRRGGHRRRRRDPVRRSDSLPDAGSQAADRLPEGAGPGRLRQAAQGPEAGRPAAGAGGPRRVLHRRDHGSELRAAGQAARDLPRGPGRATRWRRTTGRPPRRPNGRSARQIVPVRVPPEFEAGERPTTASAATRRWSRLASLQAGLRPPLRHGHRGQHLLPHRRRGGGAAGVARRRRSATGWSRWRFCRSSAVAALDPLEELLLGPGRDRAAGPRRGRSRARRGGGGGAARGVRRPGAGGAAAAGRRAVLPRAARPRPRRWDGRPGAPQRLGRLAVGGPPLRRHRRPADHQLLPPHAGREGRYGLVAACAAGAIGIGLVLEKSVMRHLNGFHLSFSRPWDFPGMRLDARSALPGNPRPRK